MAAAIFPKEERLLQTKIINTGRIFLFALQFSALSNLKHDISPGLTLHQSKNPSRNTIIKKIEIKEGRLESKTGYRFAINLEY
ncbi:hypothetical protein [Kiloniella laminariae]|uniref:hypothetical protein n=1 Tax=Kiloniella laminariae TaxID=454162 RepID=UPI00039D3C45|nr:hypothetical protein [Kiloniella laminariae]